VALADGLPDGLPDGRPSNKYAKQTALERQDLSRTYLAHHELERVVIIIMLS